MSTERDHRIYLLRVEQGLTEREIAEVEKISRSTAHEAIKRAVKKELQRHSDEKDLTFLRFNQRFEFIWKKLAKALDGKPGDADLIRAATTLAKEHSRLHGLGKPQIVLNDNSTRIEQHVDITVDGQRSRLASLAQRLGTGIVVDAVPEAAAEVDSQPVVEPSRINGRHTNGHGEVLPS